MRTFGEPFIGVHKEGRRKEPNLNETKQPIPKLRPNRRFRKRDKTADFVEKNKML